MSKSEALGFGAVGAVIGLVIGIIIELNSPDGLSCLPSNLTVAVQTPGPYLESMFMCWVVVILSTAILGAVGTAIGALTSQVSGLR